MRLLLVAPALLLLACASAEPEMPKEPVRTPVPRPPAPGDRSGEARPGPSAARPAPSATPAAVVTPATAPVPGEGAAEARGHDAELREVIERWRKAWEGRSHAAYMAFYSADFRGDGMDRDAWAERKRAVFAGSGELRVEIEILLVELTTGSTGARVELRQRYRSSRIDETGTKTLELRREPDGWRIVREQFRRGR